jgi:hypothetical protein
LRIYFHIISYNLNITEHTLNISLYSILNLKAVSIYLRITIDTKPHNVLCREQSKFERCKKNSVVAEWQVNIYLFLLDIECVCKLLTNSYILKYNKIYNTNKKYIV